MHAMRSPGQKGGTPTKTPSPRQQERRKRKLSGVHDPVFATLRKIYAAGPLASPERWELVCHATQQLLTPSRKNIDVGVEEFIEKQAALLARRLKGCKDGEVKTTSQARAVAIAKHVIEKRLELQTQPSYTSELPSPLAMKKWDELRSPPSPPSSRARE